MTGNSGVRLNSNPVQMPVQTQVPTAPQRIAPTPSVAPTEKLTAQQQEARQLVRNVGQQPVSGQVATDGDIQQIRAAIQGFSAEIPSVNEFTQTANALQDHAVNRTTISSAIELLGHQAGDLSQRLTRAGDNPQALLEVRNAVVDKLRGAARELNESRSTGRMQVNTQMDAERTPADNRWLIRKALLGGMDRGSQAGEQRQRLDSQAGQHRVKSGELGQLASQIQDGRATSENIQKGITALAGHPDAERLQARLAQAGDNQLLLTGLRNDVAKSLRTESHRLIALSGAETEASSRIGNLSREGVEELVANASLATSVVSSTNSLVKLVTGSVDGFMGTAASAVGVGFGALQIVSEGVALHRNVGRLNEALDRRDNAELMLIPADQRKGKIETMQAEIEKLSKPSIFRTKAGREEDIGKLNAKINALKAMGDVETTPEARAIAQQTVDSASVKFKALRVAKNVLGIAAGAVAIAVAVGAMATPVGWAAAGVALAATAGLWIYNKYQSSSKESKIEGLMQNRTQIAQQISDLEKSPQASQPGTRQAEDLASLQQLQQKNLIQLLTVSPQHASNEMIAGLKKTPQDVQMKILATQVLNVPTAMTDGPFTAQQENELREFMSRGLPIQPKL